MKWAGQGRAGRVQTPRAWRRQTGEQAHKSTVRYKFSAIPYPNNPNNSNNSNNPNITTNSNNPNNCINPKNCNKPNNNKPNKAGLSRFGATLVHATATATAACNAAQRQYAQQISLIQ